MRMTIRYPDGLRVEALLLAADSERMRLAIPSERDTVELHRVGARWRTEAGAEIEIEALIQMPGTDIASLCTVYRRAGMAARSGVPA